MFKYVLTDNYVNKYTIIYFLTKWYNLSVDLIKNNDISMHSRSFLTLFTQSHPNVLTPSTCWSATTKQWTLQPYALH